MASHQISSCITIRLPHLIAGRRPRNILQPIFKPRRARSETPGQVLGRSSDAPSTCKQGRQAIQILRPEQWTNLVDRLGEIDNPTVPHETSKYSLPAKKNRRASDAHRGE